MDKIVMSSILEKMTQNDGDDAPLRFNEVQAEAMINVLVDRLLTGPMSGLGYRVNLSTDDAGWTIRVDR